MSDPCLLCPEPTKDCIKRRMCAFYVPRKPGRPKNEDREPKPEPNLRQRTDGRYLRHHPLRLPNRQPVLIDEPVEYSGEYRAWVAEVLK